jgi:hypothetical protein
MPLESRGVVLLPSGKVAALKSSIGAELVLVYIYRLLYATVLCFFGKFGLCVVLPAGLPRRLNTAHTTKKLESDPPSVLAAVAAWPSPGARRARGLVAWRLRDGLEVQLHGKLNLPRRHHRRL